MQNLHFRPSYFSDSLKKKNVLNGAKAVALHGASHILGCACKAAESRVREGVPSLSSGGSPVDSAGPV